MQMAETNENGSTQGIASGENGSEPLTRDQVLRLSSQMIRQLHKRVSGTRFKEQRSDSAKLSHVRALVAVLTVYSSILKDCEITELDKRISKLEKKAKEKECRCKT